MVTVIFLLLSTWLCTLYKLSCTYHCCQPPLPLSPSLPARTHHMPHTHFSTGILGLRSTHYSFTFRWVLYCTYNVYEVKGSLWGILQFILSTQSSESMLLLGWQKYESKTSRRAPWSSWSKLMNRFTTIAHSLAPLLNNVLLPATWQQGISLITANYHFCKFNSPNWVVNFTPGPYKANFW